MKSLSIFPGLILLSILNTLSAQETKPYWLGVNANRSYATSGDYYGIMTNVFIEKLTKKNGIIGFEMGFNMHSKIEKKLYVIDSRNPNERIDMSYRTVMSGMQLGAYTGKQFKIAEKHFFRTDIGPILRLQFNSNDGFGVFYPPAYDIPYPLYSFENTEYNVQRTTFALGAKGALQYHYQISEKCQAGLHASAQMDTQGDLFYNYGLMVSTRFLR
jgi:hypothetical protein